MKTAASVISIIFHPLLMATYFCLILFFGLKNSIFELMTAEAVKYQLTITVFVFTFALPALHIYLMYRLGKIKSIFLSKQNERTFPYIMTSLFYFGLFYLLFDIHIWETLKLIIFCSGVSILITALINIKYKISAHMVGIGGMVGLLVTMALLLKINLFLPLIVSILISGIVGSSRIYLKEHKPNQIYSGFFLGFLSQLVVYILLDNFNFY